MIGRRRLLVGMAGGMAMLPLLAARAPDRRLNILWRQGWDTRNIGDVAHVPGAIALLRRYVPEASITLWASQDLVFRGETARLAGFADGAVDAGALSRTIDPFLEIVYGNIDARGRGDNPMLDAAVARADIMVHGTGAGVLTGPQLNAFRERTGHPTGIFAITIDPLNFTSFKPGSPDLEALRAAKFVFTRETMSLQVLAGKDVDGPEGTMRDNPATRIDETINRSATGVDLSALGAEFVPDTAFAFPLRNETAARTFMAHWGLQPGKFACFVPRHRWTPNGRLTPRGDSRDDYNANYFAADHSKLIEALTAYVTRTGNKAVIVPETVYALPVLRPLRDQLPPDVASRTAVLDQFWLPDMAAALFGHAQAVVSLENHSPIIALAAGTPMIMLHQPEDTIKSQMFSDIGLADWHVQDINAASGAAIARILIAIAEDQRGARARVAKAMALVEQRQRSGMMVLRKTIGLG